MGKHRDDEMDEIERLCQEKRTGKTIPKEPQNKNTPPPQQSYEDNNKMWAGLSIIALGYLAVLLPGTIGVNGFTMFLGIIAAGILIVSFFRWLNNG